MIWLLSAFLWPDYNIFGHVIEKYGQFLKEHCSGRANRRAMPMSKAMSKAITAEASTCLADLVEVSLDAFLEEGCLREIPFISTVISI
jgi:hypothetical protein